MSHDQDPPEGRRAHWALVLGTALFAIVVIAALVAELTGHLWVR